MVHKKVAMPTSRKPKNKWKALLRIVQKYGKHTIGSLIVLVCLYLLILGKLSKETIFTVLAVLIAAGYLPKIKDDDDEDNSSDSASRD